ncbi:MAG: hypothetical protein AAGB04_18795 [Pseudomonadota bacterium]
MALVSKLSNLWAVVLIAAISSCSLPPSAFSQDKSEDVQREQKLRDEALNTLDTLGSLLQSRDEKLATLKELTKELKATKEEAIKKTVEEKIKAENTDLAQLDKQISALTTAVTDEEANGDQNKKFNLQAELESLIQPFVKMMKDATENARQIESLKRTLVTAEKQQELAKRAVDRLELLLSVEGDKSKISSALSESSTPEKRSPKAKPSPTRAHLSKLLKTWQDRQQEAKNLEETAEQQLTVRMDQQSRSSGGLGTYATQFFRNRGLNLLLAISAFGGVFVVMGLIARLAGWIQHRQGIPRSFATRLAGLLFKVATAIAAFLAMLAVFNIMNDWLLLGIASVFAIATAWVGIKMLPSISEQITLLLNLGAVQEGERVMLAGVPWRVQRLDFYTDLVNPALDGGTFTLPVRELVGLHSRPAAHGEAWFPTRKGDWVQLKDEQIALVLNQTPELVRVQEIGGSVVTFETSAFLAEAPRNLSSGYRIQTEFGLDYKHQSIATDEIPDKLGTHVENGLMDLLGNEGVENVDVDLISLGDSAIVFEVEAVIRGKFASRYEDVEREIARLVVDACNKFNWSIPFPQMVLHRAD